jgi:hypothetical protein
VASNTAARDGSVDFSLGVSSIATRTLASASNPYGLQRSQLAWLANGTVRDSGITQRDGWIKIATIVASADYLFQGKTVYVPIDDSEPYGIWSVTGEILKINLTTGEVTNLSQQFGLYNSPTAPHAFFQQANRFLVIQSGDNQTLPLFWDGAMLRRSNGLTGNVGQPGPIVYNLNFTSWRTIPAVGQTRIWSTSVAYGGVNGDIGVLQLVSAVGWNFGTFEVVNSTPTTIELRTIASDRIGQYINMLPAYFTLTAAPPEVPINEIPASGPMDYYGNRIWYTLGRVVSAGDMIFNRSSGTNEAPTFYGFADSLLKVTENPLAIDGDGFEIPSQDGNIRAVKHGAAIDAALGQGRLFIGTPRAWYALYVPVDRQAWIDATADHQPLMTIVQLNNGTVNDRGVVAVNGDLYYQSLDLSIRSLDQSVRFFTTPGNRNISAPERRILQLADRSVMRDVSGICFDNRLWQSTMPRAVPQGIVHDAVVPLDFMSISTFVAGKQPNWEGNYDGLPIFQLSTADFGGRERAFAAAYGSDNSLQLWELTQAGKFDFSTDPALENRVKWYLETPAYTFGDSLGAEELKKLVGGEIWIDRLVGTVVFTLEWRVDSSTCWLPWITWDECSPKNTAESVGFPDSYPVPNTECYKQTMILPKPDPACAPCGMARPANIGFQFQLRLSILGYCRVRGIWIYAEPVQRGLYQPNTVCS